MFKDSLKKIVNSKKFYLNYIEEKNKLLSNINFAILDKIIHELKIALKIRYNLFMW